ncbi:glycosyltransferase [Desulfatitalea alkaliphila]|uniref:Glycosyltransferase n=1 Tax=Desulfatitalea alkaliphila TaxID=2929485 RepID=A0AA41RAF7_9BACT|nr:glycosyltransferase [Desulfatitalea alkaliphila]MCJ8501608.1 glycosyltransferase [Desulfatitalea alkaliphila]
MHTPWDFFDKIYCISLAERNDRRQEARVQFQRVGLSRRVDFVIVDKHPTDCEQGIYESHLHCMRQGLADGAESIMIFEDDVVFDRFSHQCLSDATAFLASLPTWHLFFLGCMVKGSRRTVCSHVLQIRYRSLTHAYAVHRDFARQLVPQPWRGVPYDDFLRDLKDPLSYVVHPAMAFQSASRSDNLRYLPLDRIRRLLGGLRNLQKANAFYHRNRWSILAAHGVVLLLTLLAMR